jgi:hypothetical protein
MLWLKQLIAAILDWLTGLAREDKKGADADKIPEELKSKWKERIMEMERKVKKNETTSQNLSSSGD